MDTEADLTRSIKSLSFPANLVDDIFEDGEGSALLLCRDSNAGSGAHVGSPRPIWKLLYLAISARGLRLLEACSRTSLSSKLANGAQTAVHCFRNYLKLRT